MFGDSVNNMYVSIYVYVCVRDRYVIIRKSTERGKQVYMTVYVCVFRVVVDIELICCLYECICIC